MLDSFPPRIDIPIFYEDAQGQQQQKKGKHVMLLPHEVVGAFYRFAPVDLMTRLVGGPGVSWISMLQLVKLVQIKQDPFN